MKKHNLSRSGRFQGILIAWVVAAAWNLPGVWAYDDVRFAKPVGLEEAQKPTTMAASEDRNFVLDETKGVLYIYDAQGHLRKTVGRSGSDKENFSHPKGITVGPDGRIYIADSWNSRIQILDGDGNFQDSFGALGSNPGELKYPESVAVGVGGRVYVADTGNNRIEVFTKEGIFLSAFGEKGREQGKFSGPNKIEIDPADNIYVLDAGNGRIQKFSPKAKFFKEFNLMGSDFIVDAYGYIYMLDPKIGKIREMSPDGTILGAFGSRGSDKGQWKQASALGGMPDGSILVLDGGKNDLTRVQVANKLKVDPLAANATADLLISGPVQVWPIAATAMAVGESEIYAYLPKEGKFASIDHDGKIQSTFGGRTAKGSSATRDCGGLAVSPDHGLYVADVGGSKIQSFDASGQFLSNFAESSGFFDSKKKEGRVRNPQGLAVSDKGTIYVADTGNRRIDAFSPDGTFLFSFGPQLGSYELMQPISVVWDKAGYVYVLDRALKKVFKCQPSGGLITAWGGDGLGADQFSDPVSLAFDGNDYVYVLDSKAHRVAAFTKDGGWMTNFFSRAGMERGLSDPSAIVVQGDRLLISDPGKGKIVSYALHPHLAPPTAISTSVVEGEVTLKWKAVADNWFSQYRVLRSTSSSGPYEALGVATAAEFKDTKVNPYQTYYYRVAAESKTKDLGQASPSVAVFVPGAFNRPPIEITSVDIGNIFSANYKYYKENPIGKITVTNNVNLPFQEVKVSFQLKDFMDFGTDVVIHKLDPQEKVELPLKAILNNHILDVTEDTPIQAQFALTYFESGKQLTVSVAKPIRVYARNAITWDKPERIVTFITSNDTPVKDFERKTMNMEGISAPASAEFLNQPLVSAMKLWSALGADGIKYQPAPNNPFEKIARDPAFPEDYTQFPRETLKLKSGQCDDLATMISSLLESAGVRTALLDYPGHMALMFDTGSNDPVEIGIPETQLISYDDTYWIPVEATVIGSSLAQAHRLAINQYHEMDKKGQASIIDPRKAWALFEPATMQATDWTAEAPKPEDLSKRFIADADEYVKGRHRQLEAYYRGILAEDGSDPDALNALALLSVEMGNLDQAAEGFGKILAMDAVNAAALNNMGSLTFLRGDYAKAESFYMKASEQDPEDSGIWLNLAKCSAKMSKADKVKEFGAKALAVDPKDADLKTAVDSLSHN